MTCPMTHPTTGIAPLAGNCNVFERIRPFGTRECHIFRSAIFGRFPLVAEDLARVYLTQAKASPKGYINANRWLRTIPERLICGPWNVTHDDQALIDHAVAQARIVELARAKAYAEEIYTGDFESRTLPLITQTASVPMSALFLHRLAHRERTAGVRRAVAVGERLCKQHQIEPPAASLSYSSRLARLMCSRWWRRRLRVLSGRRLEQLMRDIGRVHKRAGIYASDLALHKRRSQQARNNALLEAFVAINQHGEQYTLAELSELGLANPSHRYAEMMLRIRDSEAEALRLGDQGLFITWTCPSKYHPVHASSCCPNPKYNGATPREAHTYLTQLWARVRAKFAREKIGIYGLRVVEPHHDGTPHWHLMLWVKPENTDYVTTVMRDYALSEEGNERGAQRYRFKVERIDPKKGGAVSYLAKYVAKGVNHTKAGDLDPYGNDIATAAQRIESWAATWGIRQFQFVGLPSVTVWRELRKINERTAPKFQEWQQIFHYTPANIRFTEKLIAACDSGQWDQFVRLMGGPMLPMKKRPARTWTLERLDTQRSDCIARGQYGEIIKSTYGVSILGVDYLTRFNRWEIKHHRELPNSTGVDSTTHPYMDIHTTTHIYRATKMNEASHHHSASSNAQNQTPVRPTYTTDDHPSCTVLINEHRPSQTDPKGAAVLKRAEGSSWIHVNNCTRPFGQPPVDALERIRIKVNNRWEELPAWRAAEKIDDYLLDSHHMANLSRPKVLTEEETHAQRIAYRAFITSPAYHAEQEQRQHIENALREYITHQQHHSTWIPTPNANRNERLEIH